MTIDTTVPRSAGWWMHRLSIELAAKQRRFKILDDYFMGRPPLVNGTPNQQSVFYKFQQIARSNFAALILQARRDRLAIRTIRTAAGSSENGDVVAWQQFLSGNGPRAVSDLARYVLEFGVGHIASAVRADNTPWFTAEDPRQMATYVNPETGETMAAFKVFHDFLLDLDFACLWLPGEKWVSTKARKMSPPRQQFAQGPPPPTAVSFDAGSFEMMPFREEVAADQSGDYPAYSERYDFDGVPVETVEHRDGVGAYELHTDLLDRINNQILQRVVIAAMQAFKQRGLELTEDLPDHDEQGNAIDYDDIFSADPGALWKLPPGAKIWESGQTDIQGILSSVKDDVLHLSATTKTPLSMFTPEGANQSASGSDLQREGLVFDVEDLQRLLGRGVARAQAAAFLQMQDAERGDLGQLSVEWLPAERYSLAERAAADNQAQSLTWRQRQQLIWQQSPEEIAQASVERTKDAMNGLLTATASGNRTTAQAATSGAA